MPTLQQVFEEYCRDPNKLKVDSDEAIRISDPLMPQDIATQSERYLHWAMLASMAEAQLNAVENQLKEYVLPACSIRARQALLRAGERISEDRVKEAAKLDPAYQQQLSVLLNAQKICSVFKKIEHAMWQRKEMIQSLNFRQGRELSSFQRESNY